MQHLRTRVKTNGEMVVEVTTAEHAGEFVIDGTIVTSSFPRGTETNDGFITSAQVQTLMSASNQLATGSITVNGTQSTGFVFPSELITSSSRIFSVTIPGLTPEDVCEVATSTTSSWYSNINGLTPIKFFDARYSSQETGSISSWNDIVGGADAIQVLAPQNPVLSGSGFIGDNGQYLEFRPSGSSTPKMLGCDSMATSLTVPYTLVSVVRHNVIDNAVKNMVAMATGGGLQWYTNAAGSVVWLQDGSGNTATFNNASARLSTTRVNLHALVVDTTSSYLWDNGLKQTGNLTLSGTYAPTTAKIGAYSTSQNGFEGDMRSLVAFKGAANQTQLETIFSGLCGQVPTNLVHVGDSLSGGVGGTALPTQVAALMTDYTWVDSDAIGGSTLVDMFARYATNVAPKYKTNMRNVLCLWGGTNDIYYGANGTTTASRFWRYCDNAKQNGWKVIVISMIPREPFNVTQDGYVSTFNSEFAQRWRTHADAAIAAHKISGLTSYNSVYWDSDTVHLNTSGYGLIARAVTKTIRQLCQT